MPNRYICDVLEEMRTMTETLNFSPMLGLIEECQTLANRMESALYDRADIRDFSKEVRSLKQEKRELELEVQEKKWELEDLSHRVKVEKSNRRRQDRINKQKEGKPDGRIPSKDKQPHA
jgi:predicted RNase H-like nuclease (RuvC/YqgF family)